MTAAEELRRLLDELRKLACDINEEEIRSHSVITLNQGRYNRQFRLDMNHDWLNAWHTEFERILRAIAATLGPGTCRIDVFDNLMESEGAGDVWLECSRCHWKMDYAEAPSMPLNYCPNCGARVVSGDGED